MPVRSAQMVCLQHTEFIPETRGRQLRMPQTSGSPWEMLMEQKAHVYLTTEHNLLDYLDQANRLVHHPGDFLLRTELTLKVSSSVDQRRLCSWRWTRPCSVWLASWSTRKTPFTSTR